MIYSKLTILNVLIFVTSLKVEAEDANITSTSSTFYDIDPELKRTSRQQQAHPNELDIEKDLFSLVQIENSLRLNYNLDHLQDSLSNLTLNILTAQAQLAPRLATIHRYDNEHDIRLASGPQVNQEKCLRQLEELVDRAEIQRKEKFSSVDVNFHRLLDTFGRVPSGLFLINTLWPGMYEECLALKIKSKENNLIDTRYCLASFRYNSWPQNKVLGSLLGYESGVCIPKECDSSNYENKFQLIQKLMDFNARDIDKNQTEMNYLYCLPDDNSDLRMWWKSPTVTVILALGIGWLTVLIFCSFIYESKVSLQNKQVEQSVERRSLKYLKCLSMKENFRILTEDLPRSRSSKAINLQTLDGIKVICMFTVILGHSSIFMLRYSSNMRESPGVSLSLSRVFSFGVSLSFTITGILTAYKLFRTNQARSMLIDPKLWSESLQRRYVRIIPAYAFVFALGKYLTALLSSGPMWDYGTSSLSSRKICQQESWLWPLLLISNFKSPLDHCLMPGWYLANDFQFAIIAPVFLYILHRYQTRGKIIFALTIIASMLASSISLSLEDSHIVKQLYKFPPFTITLTTFIMYNTYNLPVYRISAYLLGMLVGYELYIHEKQLKESKEDNSSLKKEEYSGDEADQQVLWFNRRSSLYLSLLAVFACMSVPFISANLELSHKHSLYLIISTWPIFFFLFPLAVGLYISREATRKIGRQRSISISNLLSASIWKLLAKLNLSVLVIHSEILHMLISSKPHPVHLTLESHLAIILLGLLTSYIAGFLVYIFIEAPMSSVLNQLVTDFYDLISNKKETNEGKRGKLHFDDVQSKINSKKIGLSSVLKRELDYFTSRIIKNIQKHFD